VADSALARHAGPITLAAGAALALLDLARWVLERPDDRVGMMADPLFRVANGAYFVAFIGLAIALVALQLRLDRFPRGARRHHDPGRQHVVRPLRRAVVAPQVFDAEKTITLVVGAIAAYLTFALGWVLFGIALLRTRVVPVAVPPGWSSAGCSASNPGCRPSASRSAWPSPRWGSC